MIKILIIEDEIPARNKLKRFINEMNEATEIVAEIDSVSQAITFLSTHRVDIIFSDIELLDGNAFDIYKQVTVHCPIIFTTAYDQFLMNAFEGNGIEYLLKPFSLERFQKAWNKFLSFQKRDDSELLIKLNQLLHNSTTVKNFKKRFTINSNSAIYFIETDNITFFSAVEGVIFAYDNTGKKHLLTIDTLKEIETQLDPEDFFRVNRSDLVNKKYIEKVERYSKNALSLKVKGYSKPLITSQSQTSSFREWIER